MSPLASIHVLLPLTMGMCVSIGVLHPWLYTRARRRGARDAGHGRVALWCGSLLALGSEIARAHGGEIGVETGPEGSRFELRLPRVA